MFIKHGKEKIVNLDNVSNIYVENTENGKVIFNTNYSIKIFDGKMTPDYIYWKFSSKDELDEIVKLINDNTTGWIKPQEPGQRYVNTSCISSISIDENKNRVIFNLNYCVAHPTKPDKLTSDFVFFNFSTKDNYNMFCRTLSQL